MRSRFISAFAILVVMVASIFLASCGGHHGSGASVADNTAGAGGGGTGGNGTGGGGGSGGSGGSGGNGGGGDNGGGGSTPLVSNYIGGQSTGHIWKATITSATAGSAAQFTLTDISVTPNVQSTGTLSPLANGFSAISGTNGFVLEVKPTSGSPGIAAIVSRDGDPNPIFLVPQATSCPAVSTNPSAPTAAQLVSMGGSGWSASSGIADDPDIYLYSSSGSLTLSVVSESWGNSISTTTDSSGTCSNAMMSWPTIGTVITAPPAGQAAQSTLYLLSHGIGNGAEAGGSLLDSAVLAYSPAGSYVGMVSTAKASQPITTSMIGASVVGGATVDGLNHTLMGTLQGGRFDAAAQSYNNSEITISLLSSGGNEIATLDDTGIGMNGQAEIRVVPTFYSGKYFLFGFSETSWGAPYAIVLIQQ